MSIELNCHSYWFVGMLCCILPASRKKPGDVPPSMNPVFLRNLLLVIICGRKGCCVSAILFSPLWLLVLTRATNQAGRDTLVTDFQLCQFIAVVV